jgi:O-antigen/teichoic acid export membrane protein
VLPSSASSLLLAGADTIASSWLKVEHLPVSQVSDSIKLMAGIIGLRWVAGLYRGAIGGFEQQVWLGKLNAGAATARFVLVLVIFETLGTTPLHFFTYQLLVACVETALLAQKTYRLMPVLPAGEKAPWSLTPLREVMKFSLTIAFTSSVWVFVTQTDKLVLSKMLPLSIYAYFTLAVLVASGVTIMSGPISTALMPRLSRLHAQGRRARAAETLPSGHPVRGCHCRTPRHHAGLLCRTLAAGLDRQRETARQAAPVLRLYALGNGVLALGAFPYYLQFAKGDLRLHMLGNVLFVVLLIPSIIGATYWYGATGAGWAWLAANSLLPALGAAGSPPIGAGPALALVGARCCARCRTHCFGFYRRLGTDHAPYFSGLGRGHYVRDRCGGDGTRGSSL